MEKYTYTIETTVIGTEDGKETYEVHKRIDTDGKAAVLIALYPTVSLLNPMTTDNSTNYLMNHINGIELAYNDIRIVNLYSTVCKRKPLAKQLVKSPENMEHIKQIFDTMDRKNTDILIAWGSSLQSHKLTNQIKAEILGLIVEKGLLENVKHIVTDTLDTQKQLGTHCLWLGLRGNDAWYTVAYPVEKVLAELKSTKQEKTVKEASQTEDEKKDGKQKGEAGEKRKGRKKKEEKLIEE